MFKKILFCLFAVVFSLNSSAVITPINLQMIGMSISPYDDEDDPIPHRGPDAYPTAYYEDAEVTVCFSEPVTCAAIVIRDNEGEVIYYDFLWSLYGAHSFILSDEIVENRYSLEIIYDSVHLYGEF